jgi:hypothetical protein
MPFVADIIPAVATAVVGSAVSSIFAPSPGSPTGAQGAAAASDPFASQRGQYQTQLNNMMQPGHAMNVQDPSYAFRYNQGLVGQERALAAGGMAGSGNAIAAGAMYGQGQASNEYANQFSRLSQLAGANIGSPAAAGQILSQAGQQQQGGATALGNAVGSAVGGLFGQTGSGSTGTLFNPTGFDTGIGGSGYTASSTGGYGSEQSAMLAAQWPGEGF